jgi:ribonucleoside-diphosphate reductase alpha chain
MYNHVEIRLTMKGEQPLPPHGACLLGSFNLIKYVHGKTFDWQTFEYEIEHAVRALDNVIDNTIYPLEAQALEAKQKRRMGIGVTALANAGEALGYPYGSDEFLAFTDKVFETLTNEAYRASALLAGEKGTFPLYSANEYLQGKFIQSLNSDVIELIEQYGIRNSHLISVAPTGTISLSADNVSGAIEPVFAHHFDRTITNEDGSFKVERVEDYNVRVFGIEGVTADQLTPKQHLDVLSTVSRWVDSAVSKTINVGDDVTWDEFKSIYMQAWKSGCKGCTTFRAAGKRYGILNKVTKDEDPDEEVATACYINPLTGKKTCE